MRIATVRFLIPPSHAAIGLLSLGSFLLGCPNRPISKVPPVQDKVELKVIPVEVNRNLDILWVIDNSKSMEGEQAALAANFPAFIDVLTLPPELGGLPNLHMGIVSTNGRQLSIGQCDGGGGNLRAPAAKAKFITDILPEGSITRSNSWSGDGYPSLAAAFSDYAGDVGVNGCGFEQHFQSVIDALDPTNANNANFIRPNALLAVIFLTDEDDCSGTDGLYANTADVNDELGIRSSYRCWKDGVICDGDTTASEKLPGVRTNCHIDDNAPYSMPLAQAVSALESVKRKNQLILASIQGDTSNASVSVIETPAAWRPANPNQPGEQSPITLAPSCVQPGSGDVYSNANGEGFIARPAVRIKALLDNYPNRSTLQSICAGDLTPALTQIANMITVGLGYPCITGDLKDADPNTAGIQPDCQVSIVTNYGEPDQSEEILPQCSTSATNNCWRIEADAMKCDDTDHHLILTVDRTQTDSDNTKTIVAGCALE